MKVYVCSEVRKRLAAVLDLARSEEVIINSNQALLLM
jgi:hypothetical protein